MSKMFYFILTTIATLFFLLPSLLILLTTFAYAMKRPGGIHDRMRAIWHNHPAVRFWTTLTAICVLLGYDKLIGGGAWWLIARTVCFLFLMFAVMGAYVIAVLCVHKGVEVVRNIPGWVNALADWRSQNDKERDFLASQLNQLKRRVFELMSRVKSMNAGNSSMFSEIQRLCMVIELKGGRRYSPQANRRHIDHSGFVTGLPNKVEGLSASLLARLLRCENEEILTLKHVIKRFEEIVRINARAVDKLEEEEARLQSLLEARRSEETALQQKQSTPVTRFQPRRQRVRPSLFARAADSTIRESGEEVQPVQQQVNPLPDVKAPLATVEHIEEKIPEPEQQYQPRLDITREQRKRALSPAPDVETRRSRQRMDETAHDDKALPAVTQEDTDERKPLAPIVKDEQPQARETMYTTDMDYEFEYAEEVRGGMHHLSINCSEMETDDEVMGNDQVYPGHVFQPQTLALAPVLAPDNLALAPVPRLFLFTSIHQAASVVIDSAPVMPVSVPDTDMTIAAASEPQAVLPSAKVVIPDAEPVTSSPAPATPGSAPPSPPPSPPPVAEASTSRVAGLPAPPVRDLAGLASSPLAPSAPAPADNPLAEETERDELRPVTVEHVVAAGLAFSRNFVRGHLCNAGVHPSQVREWQTGYEARLREAGVAFIERTGIRPPWARGRAVAVIQSEFTKSWNRIKEELEEGEDGSWERLHKERGKWLMAYLQKSTKIAQPLRPVHH